MSRPNIQFRLVFLFIALSAASVAFAFFRPPPHDPRHLLQSADFTCADIARAVNYYVDIGEAAAINEFTSLARRDRDIGRPDLNERIGWLCRILYEPTNGSLRAPMLGGLMLPHDQIPLTKWPLFPVAKSGETYCVLSEGYTLAGFPEPIPDYLTYCKTHGSFRTERVPVPDRKTAIQDVNAIRFSKRWTDIKWKNSGQGFSYTMSEPWIWDAIIAQAESMKK